jgi:hypothetical protein
MPPCGSHKGPQTAFRVSCSQSPERHAKIKVSSSQRHEYSVVPVGSHWQVVLLKVWPGSRQVLETHLPPHDTCPDGHAATQMLPSHLPLQHCVFFLHTFPVGLHRSAPASRMPRDASVPPTRAAPINLSALPREMLPLASPLASSSKELASLSSLVIGYPFPRRAGLLSPAVLYNATTLAMLATRRTPK